MDPQPPSKPEWAQGKRDRRNAERAEQGLPPRRRRWPWVLLALIVLAALAAFVLSQRGAGPEQAAVSDPAAEVQSMQLRTSEVAAVAPQRLVRQVKVTGSLTPRRQTEIAAEVGGRVQTVSVRQGDAVEEGDVLVEFDTEALEIMLKQQRATADATRAQLTLAELELERTAELIERNVGATAGFDTAQAKVDQLRATLASLEAQVDAAVNDLEHATVRAPMEGWVSERSVNPGQAVASGAPLLSLVDLTEMEMEAAAPVGFISSVEIGQPVEINVEGVAGRTFPGEVVRISPVAQEGTRTLPVFISLDNSDGTLRGGMFATGQIVVEEKENAIAVPANALREDNDGSYVLKVEGDKVVRQPVEVAGQWDGGLAEIGSGLAEGDVVVTALLPQLKAGTAIEMVEG